RQVRAKVEPRRVPPGAMRRDLLEHRGRHVLGDLAEARLVALLEATHPRFLAANSHVEAAQYGTLSAARALARSARLGGRSARSEERRRAPRCGNRTRRNPRDPGAARAPSA